MRGEEENEKKTDEEKISHSTAYLLLHLLEYPLLLFVMKRLPALRLSCQEAEKTSRRRRKRVARRMLAEALLLLYLPPQRDLRRRRQTTSGPLYPRA